MQPKSEWQRKHAKSVDLADKAGRQATHPSTHLCVCLKALLSHAPRDKQGSALEISSKLGQDQLPPPLGDWISNSPATTP